MGLYNKVVPYACDKNINTKVRCYTQDYISNNNCVQLRPVLIIGTFWSNGLKIRQFLILVTNVCANVLCYTRDFDSIDAKCVLAMFSLLRLLVVAASAADAADNSAAVNVAAAVAVDVVTDESNTVDAVVVDAVSDDDNTDVVAEERAT